MRGMGWGGVRVCARAFVRAGRFDMVTSIPFSFIDLYVYEVRVAPELTQ